MDRFTSCKNLRAVWERSFPSPAAWKRPLVVLITVQRAERRLTHYSIKEANTRGSMLWIRLALNSVFLCVIVWVCKMTNVTESHWNRDIWKNAIVFCFFGIFQIFGTSHDHYGIFQRISDFYQCCILKTAAEERHQNVDLKWTAVLSMSLHLTL